MGPSFIPATEVEREHARNRVGTEMCPSMVRVAWQGAVVGAGWELRRAPVGWGSKRGMDTERVNEPSRDGAPRHGLVSPGPAPTAGWAPAAAGWSSTGSRAGW